LWSFSTFHDETVDQHHKLKMADLDATETKIVALLGQMVGTLEGLRDRDHRTLYHHMSMLVQGLADVRSELHAAIDSEMVPIVPFLDESTCLEYARAHHADQLQHHSSSSSSSSSSSVTTTSSTTTTGTATAMVVPEDSS
jgi:hypothetical protein